MIAEGPALLEGETLDAIGGGQVRLIQRAQGYRFNVDSVLLAAFALGGRSAERALSVVDLGTGCGIVALLVAHWRRAWRVSAVEVQQGLAALARRNVQLNALPVQIVEADWRQLGERGRAGTSDLVVCNPPYFAVDGGKPSPDPERRAARSEVHGSVGELARAMRRLVHGRGSVALVYPAARLTALLSALQAAGFGIVRLRMVHPRAEAAATVVLVEAALGAKGPLLVEGPLVVHAPGGGYAPEVAAWLAGEPPVGILPARTEGR